MKILLGALVLLFISCLNAAVVRATDFNNADNLMAMFVTSTCPSGWTTMSGTGYAGRILKGSSAGQGTKNSAVLNNDGFYHKHDSWAFYTVWTNINKGECWCWLCQSCGAKAIDDNNNNYVTQGNSQMATSSSNLPYVSINLCKYTSTTPIEMAAGLIAYFDQASCPATKTSFYTVGDGRTIMFAGSNVAVGTAGPGAVGSLGDMGAHQHNMQNSNFSPRRRRAALSNAGTTFAGFTSTQTFWHWTATSSNGMNIGYYQTAICQINNAGGSSIIMPHRDAMFFGIGNMGGPNGCPVKWREPYGAVASDGNQYGTIPGRIPKVVGSGYPTNVGYGGAQSRQAIGLSAQAWALDDHSHSVWAPSVQFIAQDLSGAWDACCNDGFMEHWNYAIQLYTAGISSGGTIPYVYLRACIPQAATSSPTKSPTKSPTTSRPTKAPLTSYPTVAPTDAPATSSPTGSPTNYPTYSPETSRPTLAPTTGAPSLRPTTSVPTISPSNDPTTSPTPAPVWVNVCSGGDQDLFQDYNNYVIQAASCSDECAVEILTPGPGGRKCVDLCVSIELYTGLCRHCIADFAICQEDECRSKCVQNRFSKGCNECTDTNCREAFNICSGLEGSDTASGGGDGAGKAPKPKGPKVNYALIAGSTLGGLIGLGAAVFAVRRYQLKRGMTKELTTEMEGRIFKNTPQVEGEDMMAGVETSAADGSTMSANPMYGHASMQVAAPLIVGGVVLSSATPAVTDSSVGGKLLRTRFSFHGTDADEIDVDAGEAVTAIERNADWYLVKHEGTKRIGLIPATYVIDT